MRKPLLILFAIIAVILVAWMYPPNPTATLPDKEIKTVGTFDECVAEGNPISESYPPTCRTKDGKVITQNIGNENAIKDMIRLNTPRPDEKIVSPLNIDGEARGSWFFEAQFPAKLLGEKGEIIGEGIMTTQGQWMTKDFVPFSGEIVFDASSSAHGKLILEKANPSGISENEETLIVPVVFR